MRFPRWLRVFASWLDCRVNFGARHHLVHYPNRARCVLCEAWLIHDDSFHDDAWLDGSNAELLLRDLQEAGRR